MFEKWTDYIHFITGFLCAALVIIGIVYIHHNHTLPGLTMLIMGSVVTGTFIGWQMCERIYDVETSKETIDDFIEFILGYVTYGIIHITTLLPT